jgi:hypothetical protein
MRLSDLKSEFLVITGENTHQRCASLAQAQGVMFMCPKCFEANRSPVGTHWVLCWFAGRGVPDNRVPIPGRWHPHGTEIDDLTFVGPGAVSVLLTAGCRWHGFIRNGEATLA